jgi:NADH-quinone oxidoreductase subunit E
MTADKHSQDALAKLYAEWVSAGVKLSVAGFAASTKIMEAATQSVLSARAKANEAIRARESGSTAKAEPRAGQTATVEPQPRAKPQLKAVPKAPVEKPVAAPKIEAIAKVEPAPAIPVASPAVVSSDNLKQISGIGPKLEQMLQKRGLTTIAAIAGLSDDAAAQLDWELGLDGRIARDGWIAQAKKLAGGA